MDGVTEMIISEVQKVPILWKETLKNYKNTTVTDKLWQDVGVSVGLSGKLFINILNMVHTNQVHILIK